MDNTFEIVQLKCCVVDLEELLQIKEQIFRQYKVKERKGNKRTEKEQE